MFVDSRFYDRWFSTYVRDKNVKIGGNQTERRKHLISVVRNLKFDGVFIVQYLDSIQSSQTVERYSKYWEIFMM